MIKKFNVFNLYSINEDLDDPRLNKLAKGKVRAALTSVMAFYNFFADLFFQLNIAEASPGSGIDTMATDGQSILYNPNFVNNVLKNTEEVAFVLIHEVMHNANLHFVRQGDRNHDLWNQAADYAINLQISDMSKETPDNSTSKPDILKVPSNILLDEKYRDLSAEQIYDILEKEQKSKPNKPGQGQGQPGQGQPGQGQPGQGQPGQGQPGQGQGQPGKGDSSIPGTGDLCAPGSLSDKKGPTLFEGSEDLSTIKEWYLVALKGLGRLAKSLLPL